MARGFKSKANPLAVLLITLSIVGLALANSAPVADAGLDRNVYKNGAITLQGGAYDPDGDQIVDWLWTVELSPEGSNPYISDIHRPDASFSGDVTGNYVLSLKASDGNSWSEIDLVLIRVIDTNCPAGDLTGDCWVSIEDLYMFCTQWLNTVNCFGQSGCADLTNDNNVNSEDFAKLASDWISHVYYLDVIRADGNNLLDAYNQLKSSAPATLYLLAGTYQLGTKKFVLDTNDISIKGIGNVIITRDGGTTVLQTADRVHIENVTIKNTGGYGSRAFELYSINNDLSDYNKVVLEVSNPSDVNAGTYALYIDKDMKGTWRNCTISNIKKCTWEGVASPVFVDTTINGAIPDTYSYRKQITMQASPDGELTDYQIKLTINSGEGTDSNSTGTIYLANKSPNFPYDFGFKDANGTDLNYWVSDYDETSVTTYVECNLPAFGTQDFCISYPNRIPLSRSNGWATFPRLFDDFSKCNETPGHWVYNLHWMDDLKKWQGFLDLNDFKYTGEMQEGALYFAMTRNDHALDDYIKAHFNWIHNQILPDGNLPLISGTGNCIYNNGVSMAAEALGYRWFKDTDVNMAEQCYADLNSIFYFTKNNIGSTTEPNADYSLMLRGVSHAYLAFDANNDTVRKSDALVWLSGLKSTFLANQNAIGFFNQPDDIGNTIQNQMKRAYGLLFAYDCNNDPCIIGAIKRQADWMVTYRLRPDGGLKWTIGDDRNFFFVHQAWFMAMLKMLMNRSPYDYNDAINSAFGYITSTNGAGIDMMVENYKRQGAFIAYRYIDEWADVFMSAQQGQSGSYEAGAGLWGFALNYDVVKNHKSAHSDSYYDYLYMLADSCKKSPEELGYAVKQRTLSADRWICSPTVSARITWDFAKMVWIADVVGVDNSHFNTIKTTSSFDNFGLDVVMAQNSSTYNCQPEIYIRDTNEYTSCYLAALCGDPIDKIYLYKNLYYMKDYEWYTPPSSCFTFTFLANGERIKTYIGTTKYNDYTDHGTTVLAGPIALGNYHHSIGALYHSVAVRKITNNPPVISSIGDEEAQ